MVVEGLIQPLNKSKQPPQCYKAIFPSLLLNPKFLQVSKHLGENGLIPSSGETLIALNQFCSNADTGITWRAC